MFLERIGETDVMVDSDKELIAFFYALKRGVTWLLQKNF